MVFDFFLINLPVFVRNLAERISMSSLLELRIYHLNNKMSCLSAIQNMPTTV